MQYDFLKAFPKRMKSVGLYALLFLNSGGKAIWKQFGFEEFHEQLNMDFTVLLFIMEQSLKEEACTIDDISTFIDSVNAQYFRKPMTFEDCHELGDFIVNNVLSNEGRPMYFRAYDFEEMTWQPVHISYVANRIIYIDQEVRRTSYYLTDDGYNLLLGTLEIENNMKLTVQEIIFKMHLEKQSYDKALDDIKGVFNLMRIQIQKISEEMNRIRRNVLDYNVGDYEKLQGEDLATISETREKFRGYRETVQARVRELEEAQIDVHSLDAEEEKALYSSELEKIAEMALVQRFNLRTELFDKLLENPSAVERLHLFFQPLFNRDPDRIFNLNRALEPQNTLTAEEDQDSSEDIDFDEETWKKEQERLRKEKLQKYEHSMTSIIGMVMEQKTVSLAEICSSFSDPERQQKLIPDINVFKEIMVELLRVKTIDLAALRKERMEFIQEESNDFRLNDMLLKILDSHPEWKTETYLKVERIPGAAPVIFENISDEYGHKRKIRCSDVVFHIGEL